MNEAQRSFDFSSMDEDINKAIEPPKGAADGRHAARVEKATIKATKDGKPRLQISFRVCNGPSSGLYAFYSNMLTPGNTQEETRKRLGYLKKDMANLGLVLTQMSNFESRLLELIGTVAQIRVVTTEKNGQKNTNVYIDKKLDAKTVQDDNAGLHGGNASESHAEANELMDSMADEVPGLGG